VAALLSGVVPAATGAAPLFLAPKPIEKQEIVKWCSFTYTKRFENEKEKTEQKT
jgi:hypothetical protein